MKLLVIFGPPAVGKATIGRLVENQTNFKLFHNHMVMDGIIHIFGIATPAENRLSKLVRTAVIEEAAEAKLDLIFTYVWDFSKPKGKQRIDTFKSLYESHGGEVIFVELAAPLAVRVERADSPDRAAMKPGAPNGERVQMLEELLDYTSPKPFYYPERYHYIEVTSKSAADVASEIITIVES